jgi:hypothetical protein
MSEYFFIATRDPVNSTDTPRLFAQAADLARGGARVAVYLVQNGVLGTRVRPDAALQVAHEAGVQILADDFSLRERGIALTWMPSSDRCWLESAQSLSGTEA